MAANTLTAEEIKILVIRTMLECVDKGSDTMRKQLKELERTKYNLNTLVGVIGAHSELTLGDAVVNTVTSANRFLYAREMVHLLANYPAIFMEADIRYKRRKISQALYAQKDKRLISRRVGVYTVWGLPGSKRVWRRPTKVVVRMLL